MLIVSSSAPFPTIWSPRALYQSWWRERSCASRANIDAPMSSKSTICQTQRRVAWQMPRLTRNRAAVLGDAGPWGVSVDEVWQIVCRGCILFPGVLGGCLFYRRACGSFSIVILESLLCCGDERRLVSSSVCVF